MFGLIFAALCVILVAVSFGEEYVKLVLWSMDFWEKAASLWKQGGVWSRVKAVVFGMLSVAAELFAAAGKYSFYFMAAVIVWCFVSAFLEHLF